MVLKDWLKKKENCIIALVVSIILALIAGLCFDYYYDLNDDVLMKDILAGVYTGTPEGSAYGIMKNYQNPLSTLIPVRSKVKNLLFAGQNVNMHGVLGVTLTSLISCSELLGEEYLAKKIGNS